MASSISSLEFTEVFLQLALSGDLERIKQMLMQIRKITKDFVLVGPENSHQPLYMAAKGGHTHVCKYFVEELKLDVNSSSRYGETPLIAAAKEGHYPVARYLLQKGANVNAATNMRVTALHFAAEKGLLLFAQPKGSMKVLHLLISKGAVVDAISEVHGTPLYFAARGKEEAVRILLDNLANPNLNIPGVHTPLGVSIVHHSFQCVKLLVERGADVKSSSAGSSLLELAAISGENEIIKYLLDSGADPNVVDENDCTPLEHAGIRHNYKAVEILFPATAPLPFIPDWSIAEIIRHFDDDADGHKMALDDDKVSDLERNALYAIGNNEYSEAIRIYTEVLKIYPDDLDALYSRGLCWATLSEGKSALDDAEACIKLWPNNAKGYMLKAKAFHSAYTDPVIVADSHSKALLISPQNLVVQRRYWKAIDAEFYWMHALCDLDCLELKNSTEHCRKVHAMYSMYS